ncbi:MAG: type 1 glutamine amidotransferase, partial [Stellaceae bacterium]
DNQDMAKIVVLQHHPAETLGAIADALENAALAWQYIRVHEGQPIPESIRGAGGLIVMGGPQTVYELGDYPYLRDEMRLIEAALKENKPILGVCLGSQLLAATLGARVYRGASREIGWYPVRLADNASGDRLLHGVATEFTAAHWHSDIFDLPAGATALASSEKTPLQGYRYGEKAYGFLFHAEMTEEILAALIAEFGDGLKRVGLDGEAILAAAPRHLPQLGQIAATVFARWASPIQGT